MFQRRRLDLAIALIACGAIAYFTYLLVNELDPVERLMRSGRGATMDDAP